MTLRDRLNLSARAIPTWAIYALLSIPAPWLFYQGLTGGLGAEPINALEREYGELALKLLIVGLAITPLMRFARINLVKFRRAIGLMAFLYVFLHLLVWLVLDVQILAQIWADILKRPYITIGMAGFVALVPLAVTSNNWSIRKLGPSSWRRLHKLTYAAGLLGSLHFVWLTKGWQIEPLVYMGIVILLLGLRLRKTSFAPGRAQTP